MYRSGRSHHADYYRRDVRRAYRRAEGQLAKEFTDALVEVCGLKPEGVQIMFSDLQPTDYAVAGKLFAKQKQTPPGSA
jgi:phenylpyruvate tautomerase PptA (4-oxalocrotonate tautomerase family)